MNRQPAKRIFKSEDEMIQSVRGASAVGSTLMIGNADSTGSTVKALGERALGFSDVIVGRQPIYAHVPIYGSFSLAIQFKSS